MLIYHDLRVLLVATEIRSLFGFLTCAASDECLKIKFFFFFLLLRLLVILILVVAATTALVLLIVVVRHYMLKTQSPLFSIS